MNKAPAQPKRTERPATLELSAPVSPGDLSFADEQAQDNGLPDGILATTSTIAYSGGPMLSWWGEPFYVDLESLKFAHGETPDLYEHDPLRVVGRSTPTVESGHEGLHLRCSGVLYDDDPDAERIVSKHKKGHPWQQSMRISGGTYETVPAGIEASVNGRSVIGPTEIIRNATMTEKSWVAVGRDTNTSGEIAASHAFTGETPMANETNSDTALAAINDEDITVDWLKENKPGLVDQIKQEATDEGDTSDETAADGSTNTEEDAGEMKNSAPDVAALREAAGDIHELALTAIEKGYSVGQVKEMRGIIDDQVGMRLAANGVEASTRDAASVATTASPSTITCSGDHAADLATHKEQLLSAYQAAGLKGGEEGLRKWMSRQDEGTEYFAALREVTI